MRSATMRVLLLLLCCCSLWPVFAAGEDDFSRPWTFVSETSAVVYWQYGEIGQSARSFVEYGTSADLGQQTPLIKAPRWAHLHRLTGLDPDTAYYCRMILVDTATGERTESDVFSLTTKRRVDAVRLPGGIEGPPYVLDRPDTYYILTGDIKAKGTAIEIAADNVTLDLDGHTVVFGDDTAERVYGVRFAYGGKCRLVNGSIVQGRRSNVYSAAIASLDRPQATEVCGISTDVHLKCAYPLNFTHISDADVHHNHIYSRVTEIECRHYPGNVLLRFYTYGGGIHVHDNLLTEGCHWGIMVRALSETVRDIEIDHNDIRHHQQYVNGYAITPGSGADVHHNMITSTGRGIHVTGEGTQIHHNYIDTRGHMHLSDLPARTRPFHHRMIELHGIKFEGRRTKNCKVFDNFIRITQLPPHDSDGVGSPLDKMENGVYIRSRATSLSEDELTDSAADWEVDRWRFYWVKYSPDLPPVKITKNDKNTLYADFEKDAVPGEYTIYMKWEYVPPTPLNIACYFPDGKNEVYGNTFTGITHYKKTRHGGYGDTGQWATGIMFISMKYGPSSPGMYAVNIHDNTFKSNDLFLNGSPEVNMDVRLENNTFILLSTPHTVERESRFRGVGDALAKKTMEGGNTFR